LHNRTMNPRGAIAAKGIVDAAFAVVDDAPIVVTCSDVDCDIHAWTSATGASDVVVSTPTSLQRLDTAGVALEDRVGFGRQSYMDVDGDGSHELITSIAGGSVYPSGTLLTIHRSSVDALARPDVFHLPWSVLPQGLAWLERDDEPGLDIWFLDGTGGVYARVQETPETTESADDSGLSDSGLEDSALDDSGA